MVLKRCHRRRRQWDLLGPLVCKYCRHRFFKDVARFLSHLRSHQLIITPYWYTSPCIPPKVKSIPTEWKEWKMKQMTTKKNMQVKEINHSKDAEEEENMIVPAIITNRASQFTKGTDIQWKQDWELNNKHDKLLTDNDDLSITRTTVSTDANCNMRFSKDHFHDSNMLDENDNNETYGISTDGGLKWYKGVHRNCNDVIKRMELSDKLLCNKQNTHEIISVGAICPEGQKSPHPDKGQSSTHHQDSNICIPQDVLSDGDEQVTMETSVARTNPNKQCSVNGKKAPKHPNVNSAVSQDVLTDGDSQVTTETSAAVSPPNKQCSVNGKKAPEHPNVNFAVSQDVLTDGDSQVTMETSVAVSPPKKQCSVKGKKAPEHPNINCAVSHDVFDKVPLERTSKSSIRIDDGMKSHQEVCVRIEAGATPSKMAHDDGNGIHDDVQHEVISNEDAISNETVHVADDEGHNGDQCEIVSMAIHTIDIRNKEDTAENNIVSTSTKDTNNKNTDDEESQIHHYEAIVVDRSDNDKQNIISTHDKDVHQCTKNNSPVQAGKHIQSKPKAVNVYDPNLSAETNSSNAYTKTLMNDHGVGNGETTELVDAEVLLERHNSSMPKNQDQSFKCNNNTNEKYDKANSGKTEAKHVDISQTPDTTGPVNGKDTFQLCNAKEQHNCCETEVDQMTTNVPVERRKSPGRDGTGVNTQTIAQMTSKSKLTAANDVTNQQTIASAERTKQTATETKQANVSDVKPMQPACSETKTKQIATSVTKSNQVTVKNMSTKPNLKRTPTCTKRSTIVTTTPTAANELNIMQQTAIDVQKQTTPNDMQIHCNDIELETSKDIEKKQQKPANVQTKQVTSTDMQKKQITAAKMQDKTTTPSKMKKHTTTIKKQVTPFDIQEKQSTPSKTKKTTIKKQVTSSDMQNKQTKPTKLQDKTTTPIKIKQKQTTIIKKQGTPSDVEKKQTMLTKMQDTPTTPSKMKEKQTTHINKQTIATDTQKKQTTPTEMQDKTTTPSKMEKKPMKTIKKQVTPSDMQETKTPTKLQDKPKTSIEIKKKQTTGITKQTIGTDIQMKQKNGTNIQDKQTTPNKLQKTQTTLINDDVQKMTPNVKKKQDKAKSNSKTPDKISNFSNPVCTSSEKQSEGNSPAPKQNLTTNSVTKSISAGPNGDILSWRIPKKQKSQAGGDHSNTTNRILGLGSEILGSQSQPIPLSMKNGEKTVNYKMSSAKKTSTCISVQQKKNKKKLISADNDHIKSNGKNLSQLFNCKKKNAWKKLSGGRKRKLSIENLPNSAQPNKVPKKLVSAKSVGMKKSQLITNRNEISEKDKNKTDMMSSQSINSTKVEKMASECDKNQNEKLLKSCLGKNTTKGNNMKTVKDNDKNEVAPVESQRVKNSLDKHIEYVKKGNTVTSSSVLKRKELNKACATKSKPTNGAKLSSTPTNDAKLSPTSVDKRKKANLPKAGKKKIKENIKTPKLGKKTFDTHAVMDNYTKSQTAKQKVKMPVLKDKENGQELANKSSVNDASNMDLPSVETNTNHKLAQNQDEQDKKLPDAMKSHEKTSNNVQEQATRTEQLSSAMGAQKKIAYKVLETDSMKNCNAKQTTDNMNRTKEDDGKLSDISTSDINHVSSGPESEEETTSTDVNIVERSEQKSQTLNGNKNTKEKSHQCHLCSKRLTTADLLKKHIQRHSIIHKCQYCDVILKSEKGLEAHEMTHTGETKYECQYCQKRFITQSHCRQHEITHTKRFQCRFCDKMFCNNTILQRHEKIHITGENAPRTELFECRYCDSEFKSRSYREQHEKKHTHKKLFVCSYCDKTFHEERFLRAHENAHTGARPWQCRFCEKRFSQAGHRMMHERLHTGDKRHNCSHCGKGFTDKGNMKKHERIHTGEKPFKCRFCAKAFSQSGHRNEHERAHNGSYQCRFCPKVFNFPATRESHEMIHTGETRYECKVCQRRFIQHTHYKLHELSHFQKFQCSFCENTYSTPRSRKQHEIKHHGKVGAGRIVKIAKTL